MNKAMSGRKALIIRFAWRRIRIAGIAIVLCAGLSPGCRVPPPVVGLRPIYPPVRYGYSRFRFEPSPDDLRTVFVKVDSLQPVMKWKPIPPELDGRTEKDGTRLLIEHLGYDLRIWRDDHGFPSGLAYAREGLPEPCHRLEQPLEPGTSYCWSVRARFEVNGQPRITQWSFSEWPWTPSDASAFLATNPRGLNLIPPKNYFRFETPDK